MDIFQVIIIIPSYYCHHFFASPSPTLPHPSSSFLYSRFFMHIDNPVSTGVSQYFNRTTNTSYKLCKYCVARQADILSMLEVVSNSIDVTCFFCCCHSRFSGDSHSMEDDGESISFSYLITTSHHITSHTTSNHTSYHITSHITFHDTLLTQYLTNLFLVYVRYSGYWFYCIRCFFCGSSK